MASINMVQRELLVVRYFFNYTHVVLDHYQDDNLEFLKFCQRLSEFYFCVRKLTVQK